MTGFLATFDARQIRYLGEEFTQIIDAVASSAIQSQQVSTHNHFRYDLLSILQVHLAVGPIATALTRLDPTSCMLTSHHLRLAKLALSSRNYADAAQVLEKFILYIPGASTVQKPKYICEMTLSPVSYITPQSKLTGRLKYIEVLEYFLYSGMVFIGLRNWETALQCLESAVTYPAKEGSVSKVMLDAYKKWVLVGLLLTGKLLHLPRTTSASAARCYHVMGKPYETLAQIFENGTASRLKAEAEAASAIWRDDHNEGLVLHVLAAYQKFQIRGLAKVYSKISIPEVVSQTTSAETGLKLPSAQAGESLVQNMIRSGELHARLSPPGASGPSILTFSLSGQVLSEHEMQRELTTSAERVKALTREVKQTDRMLTHDKEYIKYVQKQKKNPRGGPNSSHEFGDAGTDWNDDADALLEDEDIMSPAY